MAMIAGKMIPSRKPHSHSCINSIASDRYHILLWSTLFGLFAAFCWLITARDVGSRPPGQVGCRRDAGLREPIVAHLYTGSHNQLVRLRTLSARLVVPPKVYILADQALADESHGSANGELVSFHEDLRYTSRRRS
jgi:hypothetical protein